MSKKTTTISVANTPVRRALARARRGSLILLFVVGVLAGFVYKQYFSSDAAPSPTTTQQQ